jgi:hypothetical protein
VTTRERNLAVAAAVLVPVALLVGGYLFVYQPIADAHTTADQLELAIGDLKLTEATVLKDRPRLADTLRRSLPADADAAALEYQSMLSKVLDQAQVPATGRTLKLKSANLKAPPLNPAEQDAKKQIPAYSAVAVEVTLKRVRYATLLDVLYRYHQLNVLHQITKFNVVRKDDTGQRRSGTGNADNPDLDVTLETTAISLNGAEARRSLLPVPQAAAAAAGGLGFAGVSQSPEVGRNLSPLQFVPVLATANRAYAKLLVQDIFHGPPPPPPAVVVEPPPPPKEETAPFIRLTGLGRNPDGSGSALIEDLASRNEYEIEVTVKGGRPTTRVSKFYYTAKGQKRRLDDPDSTLDISEATSGTARLFRVVGLDEAGLVLVSREAKADAGSGRRPARTPPAAAVAGPAVVAAPPEKVFVWKAGMTLDKLRELSEREGRQLVQRVLGDTGDTVTTSAVEPPAGGTE